MKQEIERKYLVKKDVWEQMDKPQGSLYRQGYLTSDTSKTIRVRIIPEKGFLTIKGVNKGISRTEFEYEIPISEAKTLIDDFSMNEVSKTRYIIPFNGKLWEVDEFVGDNQGLLIAEIELTEENEPFDIPSWVGDEITHEDRYYNVNLAINPYKNWE